jgi:hypothetical protein
MCASRPSGYKRQKIKEAFDLAAKTGTRKITEYAVPTTSIVATNTNLSQIETEMNTEDTVSEAVSPPLQPQDQLQENFDHSNNNPSSVVSNAVSPNVSFVAVSPHTDEEEVIIQASEFIGN